MKPHRPKTAKSHPPPSGRGSGQKRPSLPQRDRSGATGPGRPAPFRRSTAKSPQKPLLDPAKARHIVVFKPYDVLSQFTPETDGHRTLAEFGLPKEVYVAGRLDRDSEGLLLLTNDGPLIKRLLDPRFGHPRSYLVQVEGIPTEDALHALRQGVDIRVGKTSYRTQPCTVDLLNEEPDLPPRSPPIRHRATIPTSWLRLTLSEGKNRQVRKMTAAVGFPTLRLVRHAIGALRLGEGLLADLQPGQWIEVPADKMHKN